MYTNAVNKGIRSEVGKQMEMVYGPSTAQGEAPKTQLTLDHGG